MATLFEGKVSSPNANILSFVRRVVSPRGLPTRQMIRLDREANLWLFIEPDRSAFTVYRGPRHSAKEVLGTVQIVERFTPSRLRQASDVSEERANAQQLAMLRNTRKAVRRQVRRTVEQKIPSSVLRQLATV